MTDTAREPLASDRAPESDAVREVLAAWGLTVGVTLQGFTVARVGRSVAGDAAVILLVRGDAKIEVRLQRASTSPRFARVGELDVVHGKVDASLSRELGILLRVLVATLSRHGAGAPLSRLLTSSPEPAPAPLAPAPPGGGEAYASGGEAPELDPAKQASSDRPFMRFDTIEVSDLERYPDAIRQMYAGTLGGLVIRNVYAKEDMSRITATLERSAGNYPRTSFPSRFKAHFYGRCLDGSDPLLDEYLRDAERFRQETLAVFQGAPPFEERIEEMFRAIAGGRKVELPRYTDGRAYTSATVRFLLEGGQIGTHCGNEASTRPAYQHLNSIIDRGDQISYFLTLQHAEVGGELIVYSLKWSDIDPSRIVGGRSQVDDLLGQAEWMSIAPQAGDLLLFDGGRYFHRVAKVKGSRVRFTIGGFMMFDQPGQTLYYWS